MTTTNPTSNAFSWTYTPPEDVRSKREQVLDGAKEAIMGDRNNQYGPPTQDFDRIAKLLTSAGFYFISDDGDVHDIQAHQVSIIMILLKVSRLTWNPAKEDSWLDIAGYAACGYECVADG